MLLFLIFSFPCLGQTKSAASPILKLLSDTTLIHAIEITLAPGQRTEVNTRSAYFFYALTTCNLQVHFDDGKTESLALPAGGNSFSSPEGPHYTVNMGNKQARFLVVELKEHPYLSGGKSSVK